MMNPFKVENLPDSQNEEMMIIMCKNRYQILQLISL